MVTFLFLNRREKMYSLLAILSMLKLMKCNIRHTKDKKPIVFVPGITSFIGKELISETPDLGFGMSHIIYKPFIQRLEDMGYKKEENLFISFYDFRKDCRFCAEHYLKKTIDKAKEIGKTDKVDLISYSLGGLVARAYVQGERYKNDVENLIMIATPNAGSVDRYYSWLGGKLLSRRSIHELMIEGYLWMIKKIHGSDQDGIRDYLDGMKDSIPSSDYGGYLYYYNKDGSRQLISYNKMKYKNEFLDQLNKNQNIIKKRGINLTLIGGGGSNTHQYLKIDRGCKNRHKWLDGKVVAVSRSKEGDGVSMLRSVFAIDGDSYVVEATHRDILKKSESIIRKKLGVEEDLYEEHIGSDDYMSVLVKGKGNITIKEITKKGTYILYDGVNKKEDVYIEEYKDIKWIILNRKSNSVLHMEYVQNEDGELEMVVDDCIGERKEIHQRYVFKNSRYRVNLS